MALVATASQALAQAAAGTGAVGPEEVVVTATRQSDTVNRVPLSIVAVTQTTLDEQGIKVATDLTRTVPGLSVPSNATNTGVATFGIRGIVATVGAATTGVYLDDTSLTKRSNTGIFQQNGAPLPVLYDLQRVEVLKGPQGTSTAARRRAAPCASSRPSSSLSVTSGSLRIEGNKVKAGEEGYDIGAAVGGPIVEDKLGFRISGLRRKTAGWIDAYNPLDNSLIVKERQRPDRERLPRRPEVADQRPRQRDLLGLQHPGQDRRRSEQRHPGLRSRRQARSGRPDLHHTRWSAPPRCAPRPS